MRSTVVESLAEGTATPTRVQEARYRVKVSRDGNWKYRAVFTPMAFTVRRDRVLLENSLTQAMRETPLVLEVWDDGTFGRVHGLAEIVRKMREGVPEQAWAAVEEIVSERSLAALFKAHFEEEVTAFVNKTFAIGETWQYNGPIEHPWGFTVNVNSSVTFTNWQSCGSRVGRDCVRMEIVFSAGGEEAAKWLGRTLSTLVPNCPRGLAGFKVDLFAVEGQGTRVVEPSTLDVYEELEKRTTRIGLQDGTGVKHTVVRKEERESRLETSEG